MTLPYLVAVLAGDGTCRPVPRPRSCATPPVRCTPSAPPAGPLHADRLWNPPVRNVRGNPHRHPHRRDAAVAGLRVELRLGARPTDPGLARPRCVLRAEPPARLHPPLPAVRPGRRTGPHGSHRPRLVLPRRPLRHARRLRPGRPRRRRTGHRRTRTPRQQGVGFALLDQDRPALRLHAPYREEPVSLLRHRPAPPRRRASHLWQPGERHTLHFTVHLTDADPHAYAPVLRALHTAARDRPPGAWVGVHEAAGRRADGLAPLALPRPPAGSARDRRLRPGSTRRQGDRQAMHVSWISGTPYAHALLLHARRTGDAARPRPPSAYSTTSPHPHPRRHLLGPVVPQQRLDRGLDADRAGCTPAPSATPPSSSCARSRRTFPGRRAPGVGTRGTLQPRSRPRAGRGHRPPGGGPPRETGARSTTTARPACRG